MKKIMHFINGINEYTGRIFCWTVILLNIIVVLEVVLRYFFNRPTTCNFELTKQLFALNFMITAGYTLLHAGHVSIDIIYEKLPKRGRAVLDLLTYMMFFFPFAIIVFIEGIIFSAASWKVMEKEWSVCGSPLYPIKTVIPITGFLLLIQGIVIFIERLKDLIAKQEEK